MKLKSVFYKILLIFLLCVSGCITPRGFLQLPENYLEARQLQSREFETKDEKLIMSASAGVLQDLGFILADSETELGMITAAKKADATDIGQIIAASIIDALASSSSSNAYNLCDDTQDIRATIIVKPSLLSGKMTVRATFQRVVWNKLGQINNVENISDPAIYQSFFENLSKAIFLEAHKI